MPNIVAEIIPDERTEIKDFIEDFNFQEFGWDLEKLLLDRSMEDRNVEIDVNPSGTSFTLDINNVENPRDFEDGRFISHFTKSLKDMVNPADWGYKNLHVGYDYKVLKKGTNSVKIQVTLTER